MRSLRLKHSLRALGDVSCSRKHIGALKHVEDSIGLMLRSPPCPQGKVGVSKHEAAPSFETPACRRAPQDEGGGALHKRPSPRNATRTASRPSLSFLLRRRRSALPREPVEARLLLIAERAV